MTPRRVGVLRALQVGDMLCAIPALRSLRAGLPDAEIVLIGLPWARWMADRFPSWIDGFIEFPGFPGMPERRFDPKALLRFLSQVQEQPFDLAIQMHGDGSSSNRFLALIGAAATAGFRREGDWCPENGRFLEYPGRIPEVRRLLRLTAYLGMPSTGEEMELPTSDADHQELAEVDGARLLEPGCYACLHPGARDPMRRWSPEAFAAVGDALDRQGLRIAITGSADEAPISAEVARAMKAPAIDLCCRQISLGALAAVIEGARIVITNDTGVSHIASALRVPSVVIFLASDPARWAPIDGNLHRAIHSQGGRAGVTPQRAIAEAQDLLQFERVPAR